MNKIAGYIGYIGGFIIAYAVGRYYPGIFLQLIIAYSLYWLGKKAVKKFSEPNPSKDGSKEKWVYILSGLGLLGLLSPILGFIFALPSFLIATELISHQDKSKKKLIYISSVVVILCLLNAVLGTILYQAGIY